MCYTPITIRKDTPDAMTVGCGRCEACHLKYVNQWRFRMHQHALDNPIYYCVTLTYNGEHLPIVKDKTGRTWMTLVRAHASNFFKTLRNNHNKRWKNKVIKPRISYLIAGEYGDKFKRPHYHAIIFNANPEDILKSWDKGLVYFGENNLKATTNYTLKYAMKSRLYKLGGSKPYERPFINVSKGIGLDYIVNRNTGEMKVTKLPDLISFDGIKLMLPRYYANKLNIDIDTEKFRDQQIQADREMREHLKQQNITYEQWRKMYHKYLYLHRKDNAYDNEVSFEQLYNRVINNLDKTKPQL